MVYLTGDTHGSFLRFTKNQRAQYPFDLTSQDKVIVCGDFGLLWVKDATFTFDVNWLGSLPFQILWVQGNHENYDLIAEYPIELWMGGKARHIVRDKIILLERGQVFEIENKTFFTMGGAASHDMEGGVLDRSSPSFQEERKRARKKRQVYRVLRETWWPEELPSEEELQEGRRNLAQAGYQVDYVISHCGSTRLQERLKKGFAEEIHRVDSYTSDRLTDYFDELEDKLQYCHWYCGHYHKELRLDGNHTILYEGIVPLEHKAGIQEAAGGRKRG